MCPKHLKADPCFFVGSRQNIGTCWGDAKFGDDVDVVFTVTESKWSENILRV